MTDPTVTALAEASRGKPRDEELFDHERRWRRLSREIAVRKLQRDANRLGFRLVELARGEEIPR